MQTAMVVLDVQDNKLSVASKKTAQKTEHQPLSNRSTNRPPATRPASTRQQATAKAKRPKNEDSTGSKQLEEFQRRLRQHHISVARDKEN
jgi:hypothetical protein